MYASTIMATTSYPWVMSRMATRAVHGDDARDSAAVASVKTARAVVGTMVEPGNLLP
jgi:hypothetical protein